MKLKTFEVGVNLTFDEIRVSIKLGRRSRRSFVTQADILFKQFTYKLLRLFLMLICTTFYI